MNKWLRLERIQVYGDTKGIIYWVKEHTNFNPPILTNWMKHIRGKNLPTHLVSPYIQGTKKDFRPTIQERNHKGMW